MFCSDKCAKKYRASNLAEIQEKIAERIQKKLKLQRYVTYVPLSWEKEQIKAECKELSARIDQLDYELGDY